MSKINEFLNEIGLSESQISELEKQDTDIEVIIAEWKQQNRELVKTQNKLFTQDELNDKFRTYNKKTIKSIARLIGMDMTDSQANEIAGSEGLEGFTSKAEEHFNRRISEIQTGSDEQLKTKLNDLINKTSEQAKMIDQTRDQYEAKIKELEGEWGRKLTQKEVDAKLQQAFGKVEWADKSRVDIDTYFIKQKLTEMGLVVHPDGSVTREDGTNALSLSGKSIYKSIMSDNKSENPILDIAYEKNLIKVSNGASTEQGQRATTSGQNGQKPTEFTGEAAKLLERIRQKNIEI
jgi:hypothetical protein